jgi:hypothetical protein
MRMKTSSLSSTGVGGNARGFSYQVAASALSSETFVSPDAQPAGTTSYRSPPIFKYALDGSSLTPLRQSAGSTVAATRSRDRVEHLRRRDRSLKRAFQIRSLPEYTVKACGTWSRSIHAPPA